MSKRLSGINPLAYLGVEPYTPPALHQNGRDPSVNDSSGFNLGDFWLTVPPGYSGPEKLFVLISLNMGQATWVQLYPSSGGSIEFETNSGSVNPLAGVVNVLGDGSFISTSGSGNTITISADDNIAGGYVTDSGIAVPVGFLLGINGGANIHTSGAGNVVTISLDNTVSLSGDLTVLGDADLEGTVTIGSFAEGVVQSDNFGVLSSSKGTNGQLLIGSTAGAPAWANLTSTGATVTITNGANSINLEAGGASGGTIISQFTSSGTWTANIATQYVEVYGVCGGGGGASGAVSGTTVGGDIQGFGGGGGGTWGSFYLSGPIAMFEPSQSITIGSGGAGGASVSGSGYTVGNIGGNGGATSFGPTTTPIASQGITTAVNRSGGGYITSAPATAYWQHGYAGVQLSDAGSYNFSNNALNSGNGGLGNPGSMANGFNGYSRGIEVSGGNVSFTSLLMAATGGGGAGYSRNLASANVGGTGGSINSWAGTTLIPGGAGGQEGFSIDGTDGADGIQGVGAPNFGAGGGGGGNQLSGGFAGDGGNGGFPGGGGGGGGATNLAYPATSGAGGHGAAGIVIVIEYL